MPKFAATRMLPLLPALAYLFLTYSARPHTQMYNVLVSYMFLSLPVCLSITSFQSHLLFFFCRDEGWMKGWICRWLYESETREFSHPFHQRRFLFFCLFSQSDIPRPPFFWACRVGAFREPDSASGFFPFLS
ncbi:hypothetical protein BS50DRAFT_217728 [Corynespora cassiicola Philippines]|uniref:Uncharacterized protein n=1 Tax=Corynespora cassiicola Philippines TaxID=1448308 RepID=A0A2T2N3L5_CORCC|nr:hypothetical protein BS50DRAFT_217728 [Corynespora cassiicola Philippines]